MIIHNTAVEAMNLWKEAEQLNLLLIYWVDKSITEEAWDVFQRFPTKNYLLLIVLPLRFAGKQKLIKYLDLISTLTFWVFY